MPDGARRLHGDRQRAGHHHRGARPPPRRVRRRVRQHRVPRRATSSRWSSCSRGRVAALRVHQLGRRSTGAASSSRSRESFRTHDPPTTRRRRKAYGVGKVQCEQLPRPPVPRSTASRTPSPGRAHASGPAARCDARADLLRAASTRAGRSSSRARASRSSTSSTCRRGVADGLDHRQRRRRGPDLQRRRAPSSRASLGCVRLMASAVGVEAEHRACADRDRPHAAGAARALGRGASTAGPCSASTRRSATSTGAEVRARGRLPRLLRVVGRARAATATSTTSASTTRCSPPCQLPSTGRRARARSAPERGGQLVDASSPRDGRARLVRMRPQRRASTR